MSIRTILAPGVQITEIDKSQYSPAMTGSNCYVMGFTDRGEPYQPMEFTNRAAWTQYYGEPDNEAERYAYAAACEVLNRNGRLYFARLPYDNMAFGKVAAFKYNVITGETTSALKDPDSEQELSAAKAFWQIAQADDSVTNYASIVPTNAPVLYDLSAIDEYRTDEAKVGNNTFVIADIAFNSYGRIQEDARKDKDREFIGIMPVVTTAANALYAQSLIDVKPENVLDYETVSWVTTLDAAACAELTAKFPDIARYTPQTPKETDLARRLSTRGWYEYVDTLPTRRTGSVQLSPSSDVEAEISAFLRDPDNDDAYGYVDGSWTGGYQVEVSEGGALSTAWFSYTVELDPDRMKAYLRESLSVDNDDLFNAEYAPKYGWHNPDGDDNVPPTVSREANSFFPAVQMNQVDGTLRFDRDNFKKIGIVVYKMFLDPSEGNKINFEPVEAFAGSLFRDDKDPTTGVTTFIDTIVNTQSRYINVFSNCFNTPAGREYYRDKLDFYGVRPGKTVKLDLDIEYVMDFAKAFDKIKECTGINIPYKPWPDDFIQVDEVGAILTDTETLDKVFGAVNKATSSDEQTNRDLDECRETILALQKYLNELGFGATAPSLGFYQAMTEETISISKSIYDGINKCFEKVEDVNQLDIDIIPEAGIANIASYLKALYGDRGKYDLGVTDDLGNSLLSLWKVGDNAAVKTWKATLQKLDNFCKNVRKDCMFIADGPRPLVLAGQKKVVRSTKPANTIDANIVPFLKFLTGLNTSYGACYVDWFEQADDCTGDMFWCPPSIKAMGVYVNCDVNYNYWDAPAGLNRGVIPAVDVAFSPTIKQAGCFYEKNFNYAINYPQDGIVLEGQKTLQAKPSAFDRVNVRRLFCRLERMAFKVARYFVYEGNTAYTRQRLVDALDPYFKEAKVGGGIYDYKIKCDETNNTDDTIDRNELHCAIGIKPVKTAEFIMLDFVALRTGGSWTEAGF